MSNDAGRMPTSDPPDTDTAASPDQDLPEAPPYPPDYSWETKNAVFTLFGRRRGKLAR